MFMFIEDIEFSLQIFIYTVPAQNFYNISNDTVLTITTTIKFLYHSTAVT